MSSIPSIGLAALIAAKNAELAARAKTPEEQRLAAALAFKKSQAAEAAAEKAAGKASKRAGKPVDPAKAARAWNKADKAVRAAVDAMAYAARPVYVEYLDAAMRPVKASRFDTREEAWYEVRNAKSPLGDVATVAIVNVPGFDPTAYTREAWRILHTRTEPVKGPSLHSQKAHAVTKDHRRTYNATQNRAPNSWFGRYGNEAAYGRRAA